MAVNLPLLVVSLGAPLVGKYEQKTSLCPDPFKSVICTRTGSSSPRSQTKGFHSLAT